MRRLGLSALRIAREAWLDPQNFSTQTPARATLRRKLRHAANAGVCVASYTPNQCLDWAALDPIAADWADLHHGERGFSIGRYTRSYVQAQRVFIAWQGDRPLAFVTFHASKYEWALDLMRHCADLPDGVMHLLIHHAILAAQENHIPRVSLAAVPHLPLQISKNQNGLARFKSSFAPHWQPLYLLAPNRVALAVAGGEIARAIHWPRPLSDHPLPDQLYNLDPLQADYGFATAAPTWHRQGK
jgi:phosphatidylglycerol lysyltransferase